MARRPERPPRTWLPATEEQKKPLLPGKKGDSSTVPVNDVDRHLCGPHNRMIPVLQILFEHDPNMRALKWHEQMRFMREWAGIQAVSASVQTMILRDKGLWEPWIKRMLTWAESHELFADGVNWLYKNRKCNCPRFHTRHHDILGGGEVYPHEVAHFQLSYRLRSDFHVVWAIAALQGMRGKYAHNYWPFGLEGTAGKYHQLTMDYVSDGVAKVLSDPWVRFALAAPWMTPYGVDFGWEAGFTGSVNRMLYLLKWPFQATEGEIAAVMESQTFQTGWLTFTQDLRKRDEDSLSQRQGVLVPGPIFYLDSLHKARLDPLSHWAIWERSEEKFSGWW